MRNKLADFLRKVAQAVDTRPTRQELWQRGYWVDAQGNVIHITDIDDRYLLNIARFLFRAADSKQNHKILQALKFAQTLQGEMAQDAIDAEIAQMERQGPWPYFQEHPFYPVLSAALHTRGLYWQFMDAVSPGWREPPEKDGDWWGPDVMDHPMWGPDLSDVPGSGIGTEGASQ